MEELGGFEDFWKAYPRKVGKGDAKRAWRKIRPDAELTKTMIETLQKMARCEQWSRDGGQFIPHPATWLNREGWEDEPEIAKAQAPVRKIVNCSMWGCKREGMPGLGGVCEQHYVSPRKVAA